VLKHIPGTKMGKVDSLSRKPDWKVGMERDNKNETLVKKKWLENRRTEKMEVIVEGVDLLEKIKQSRVRDNKVVKAVEEIKQAGVKVLRDKEWRDIDGVIYKEGKVYVPKNKMFRAEIIRLYHDIPIGGHGGQ